MVSCKNQRESIISLVDFWVRSEFWEAISYSSLSRPRTGITGLVFGVRDPPCQSSLLWHPENGNPSYPFESSRHENKSFIRDYLSTYSFNRAINRSKQYRHLFVVVYVYTQKPGSQTNKKVGEQTMTTCEKRCLPVLKRLRSRTRILVLPIEDGLSRIRWRPALPGWLKVMMRTETWNQETHSAGFCWKPKNGSLEIDVPSDNPLEKMVPPL